MKKFIVFLILISNIFFFNFSFANEKIAYLDIDFIVRNSLAGKSITKKINDIQKLNMTKFNKIETEIKSEEEQILAQKNILNNEEFENRINNLKKKIIEYRKEKKKESDNLNNKRINLTKKLLDNLNPLLANFSSENSLFMIVDKKSIVIGKKEHDITNDILNLLNNNLKEVNID